MFGNYQIALVRPRGYSTHPDLHFSTPTQLTGRRAPRAETGRLDLLQACGFVKPSSRSCSLSIEDVILVSIEVNACLVSVLRRTSRHRHRDLRRRGFFGRRNSYILATLLADSRRRTSIHVRSTGTSRNYGSVCAKCLRVSVWRPRSQDCCAFSPKEIYCGHCCYVHAVLSPELCCKPYLAVL